jgi:hypothetical protein
MKHGKFLTGFLMLLCAAALFLGCPTEPEDDTNYGAGDPKELEVTVTSADGTVYYSLTTGQRVTDAAKIAGKDWDIAFQRSRMIYTNSGDTAAAGATGSGGLGGVWFTDKTDFDSVSDEDAVETTGDYAEYAPFTKDVVKYTSATASSRFNVMTYWGFAGGAGTAADPYKTKTPTSNPPPADFVPYTYDKKNYISMTSMTGPNGAEFSLSKQVYIIKHGDGEHYSKIQITEYTSRSADTAATPPVLAADILKIKYQNF